jgi:hypothetical protein
VFEHGEECGELYGGGYAGCLEEEGRRRERAERKGGIKMEREEDENGDEKGT